ncbi:hypothetical protein [Streptomyces auratus]|uniref:Uncharacterized protein n=1 Tax=Streptomyces auratus AGR0001 TaxID=1160718 RepID=J1ZZF4_9ACTN|nr:hypothetical protein [Streptomyces auratus]QTZ93846.1 hypothetical protein SU9_022360 [Streptomyces auratus AGR0001]
MTHEHFGVHPDKLRALSTDFKHVSDRLEGQVDANANETDRTAGHPQSPFDKPRSALTDPDGAYED